MFAQRAMQQSLRAAAFQRPAVIARTTMVKNGAPAATSVMLQQKRVASTSTEKLTIDEGHSILVKQRLSRPVAPHLGIYKPQITWYGSAFNRITGSVLSGAFYIFGFGYLIQPLLGWHIFESSSIIAAVAGMSIYAKVPLKFTLGFFFWFHSLNGLRHLGWDMGKMIRNPAVIKSGWLVVGASAIVSAVLAVM